MNKGRFTQAGLLLALTLSIAGCASKQRELEGVAKDWCMAIRASQIIPVYPLTEDVQPGDVFLVQRTVQEQANQYSEKGYLPLDQLITRLDDLDYSRFYGSSYWKGDYASIPHVRPQPPADPAAPAKPRFGAAQAPRAAFPSYSFETKRGAGLSLAIPVQGVPLGLSIMGTDHATGSITISDAFTYGIDAEEMLLKLEDWSNGPFRSELMRIATHTVPPVYLRVVTRVYLTGGVTVSLTNQAAQSAGLDAGKAKPVGILDMDKAVGDDLSAATTGYKKALADLNGALNESAPGGSIRVAAASRRSVALREDFDRPLVIGYLGFDVQVMKDGRLGPLVATQQVLQDRVSPDPKESTPGSELRSTALAHLNEAFYLLKGRSDDGASSALVLELNKLTSLVPDKYPMTLYKETEQGGADTFKAKGDATLATADFRRVTSYAAQLNASLRALQLSKTALTAEQKKDLEDAQRELERIQATLRTSATVAEATRRAGRTR